MKHNKNSMAESERADHIFDLSHRRSSWITRELFDSVYPGVEPGTDHEQAEMVELACIAELSAEPVEEEVKEKPVTHKKKKVEFHLDEASQIPAEGE